MKKILVCLLSLFILTGCMGNNNDTPLEDKPNNDVSDNQNVPENSQSIEEDWYKNFENELAGKDFKYSSKQKLDASIVNGVEGYRYVGEQGNIDIYKYEEGNNFDAIMRDKRITIDGKEYPVEVNGNYVIVSEGVDQGIIDIFKNMK